MFIQFLIFPWAAHRFGVLNCLKAVVSVFPIIYMLTPFTVLLPVPWLRNVAIFLLMLGKLAASIFGFPCTTILLTNSASSMSVLGTLNGVGTSVSAVGRAVGPAVIGGAYSWGVKRGWGILPWWVCGVFGMLSAVPVGWIGEENALQGEDAEEVDDGDEEREEEGERGERGYGAIGGR